MSILAERAVIGSLVMDSNCIEKIHGILEPEMFTSDLLGRMYLEYQRGYDNNYPVNVVFLEQNIRSDVYPKEIIMQEIYNCSEATDSSAMVVSNANAILSDYKAHRLTKMLNSIKVTPSNIKEQIRAITEELEVLQEGENEQD